MHFKNMAMKRKIRSLKKYFAFLIGIFVMVYLCLTFYITVVSQLQSSNMNLPLRYFHESTKQMEICESEKTNFVFIKCMKCATETMGSVLRRFGYVRNMNFALPVKRNLYIGWPHPVEYSDVRQSKFPYNIIMEHSIYNNSLMRAMMPTDTSFITIIRNPWKQFQSTFNYFALGRIAQVPNENITEYLLNMEHYEAIYMSPESKSARWCIPNQFSLTKNIMSHCLGMPLGFPTGRKDIHNDVSAVKDYIKNLDKEFELVMIADYFPESLVLLKRTMCWGFKDIVYHHSNVGRYNYGLTSNRKLHDIHRNWSHVDYMLFEHFNQTFWRKVAMEGPVFMDEVEHFRLIQMVVERFCFIESMWKYPQEYITVPASKFGAEFKVTGEDCVLLNTYMLPMLWAKYYEREGIRPEDLGNHNNRPRPLKGCSI